MKVLGIGESIVDNIYFVDHITEKPQITGSARKHIGGSVLSALIVLARLGIDCTMVTTLGRDDEAKIIKKSLKHEKVKLLHKLQKKTKTNTILVQKDTGQRLKIRGATIHPDIKHLDRKFIRQFDIIILDRHERTAFYEILQKKKPRAKIIIDPSIEVSEFTLDMMRYADYPILPIESLTKFKTNHMLTSMKKLYALVKKNYVVTAGSLGSLLYDGNALLHIPAYSIAAVDTLGAGDVFRGAFTYGIIRGWDLTKSATFGNFVGGLQCTKIGNISAIPTKAEMDVFHSIYNRNIVDFPAINDLFVKSINL